MKEDKDKDLEYEKLVKAQVEAGRILKKEQEESEAAASVFGCLFTIVIIVVIVFFFGPKIMDFLNNLEFTVSVEDFLKFFGFTYTK